MKHAALLAAVAASTTVSLLVTLGARLVAPPGDPIAVVDVAALYRAKEARVTAQLVRRDATEADRARALREAAGFGAELNTLLERLPADCNCLVLQRAALLGSGARHVTDLTAGLRQQLGLPEAP